MFDVDTETANGERMNNEIAELVGRSDGTLIGFATVDPWKGRAAIRHLERCVDMGLRGLKLHPSEVIPYCSAVIPEKFLFGTDFPLFNPDRWLAEFDQLELKEGVRDKVMFENACRLLRIDPGRFQHSPAMDRP